MLTRRHDPSSAAAGAAHGRGAFESDLRAAGLRVTAPRLAVLEAVAANQHADADTLAHEVRERLGAVSKQAVYDVLRALTDAGLVRRITLDERRARYETHRHDNHHHMMCRRCGRIDDVPCPHGKAPCLDLADGLGDRFGFVVDEADVIYRGVCAQCAASSEAA